MKEPLIVIRKSKLMEWLYKNSFVECYDLLHEDKHEELPQINLTEVVKKAIDKTREEAFPTAFGALADLLTELQGGE